MHLLENSVGTQTDDSFSDASNSIHVYVDTQSMINDIIEKIPDVLMYLKSAGQDLLFLEPSLPAADLFDFVTLQPLHELPEDLQITVHGMP